MFMLNTLIDQEKLREFRLFKQSLKQSLKSGDLIHSEKYKGTRLNP